MYKNVLRSVEGLEVYPLVALAIFGIFFICLLIVVFRMSDKHIDEVSNLPLTENEEV